MKAIVTGGYFDDGGDGVVWCVDLSEERADVVLRWSPPPAIRVAGKGFAAGTLDGDELLVAAHAAVVRIDLGSAAVTGVLHQPCMNDLHHVAVHEDQLWVCNTGLGAVDVFSRQGTFLGSHAVAPAWVQARRMEGQDPAHWDEVVTPGWGGDAAAYRVRPPDRDGYHSPDRARGRFHRQKVPDPLHINHVARVRTQWIATCFADGALRDLGCFRPVWQQPGAHLHDGVVHGDCLWTTAIDGRVFALQPGSWREVAQIDAFASGHHGWCRGLAVTDDHLLVGLTEVRRGRLPRHRWSDRAPEGSETSVLLLERATGRCVARVALTDRVRHSKLHSVLPWATGSHR